ncbi:MAG TPA: hypothetical protein VFP91_09600 [Vicinamibacterales bacterium]|nr:hypothetical protein [Vicinamibacterales bacterium]
MDRISHVIRQVSGLFEQDFARIASVIGGIFLMLGALGLLATVVFFPGGLILGLAGAALIALGVRPRRDASHR